MKICLHRKFDVYKWDKESQEYKVYSYDNGNVQKFNVGAIKETGLFMIVCQSGCGEMATEIPGKQIKSEFFRQTWSKLLEALDQ